MKKFCPPTLPVLETAGKPNGLADALSYLYMITAVIKGIDVGFVPSRRWINYWADINLPNLYSQLATHGICADNLWTADDKFPKQEAVADAATHKLHVRRIKLACGDRTAIIEKYLDTQPIIIHIARYRSFDKKNLAISLTLPSPIKYNDPKDPQDPYIDESSYTLVEYDKRAQLFTAIGADGFFLIPYYYIEHPQLCQAITVVDHI